ncbi:MAG: GNAT family N-acetyltransferase [Oscillospiraceae bacterium]|nr:GNAT family N-acetyltransferase [Oscillospiraceae bacterium]MDE7172620.1 GNAT family N-acetyltransferase [Oscillospiraceae bacterium]
MLDVIPAQTQDELERCFAMRHAVFCVERGVSPDIERDEWDTLIPGCGHFLIREKVTDIGALRCRYAGDTAIIQRFCVLREYRGGGRGRAALEAVEALCRAVGIRRVELDAKFEVRGFYEKCGYRSISDPFEEAGIPHVKMMKEC